MTTPPLPGRDPSTSDTSCPPPDGSPPSARELPGPLVTFKQKVDARGESARSACTAHPRRVQFAVVLVVVVFGGAIAWRLGGLHPKASGLAEYAEQALSFGAVFLALAAAAKVCHHLWPFLHGELAESLWKFWAALWIAIVTIATFSVS